MASKSGAARAPSPIAVIGLGCWYPGAASIPELWHNILGSKQQFRPMPDCRLPMAQYQHADKSHADKTYGTQAAVIDGYAFDWAAKRIPKSAYEATDIVHWLALDVALQMLGDAGYDSAKLPRETTQVIVGNTLTGEFTRSNTLRLRWPYVQKSLVKAAAEVGLAAADVDLLSQAMEARFKSVFAATNEDSLAGGLANTIAGRICNFLNLNGGGFTVDGACSSSLIAIYTAASNLACGSCDFAIAGGVDVSLDPFELIGFAKTGALTPTQMAVYDQRGNGFIPGEGAGFVALKRLADAQRDGDKIYAVLDGWGMSSDGKGGITAPTARGQSLALHRAYGMAGIAADELDFIEGHGTGTAVGDKVELLGVVQALKRAGGAPARGVGMTSFKSIVGHTKAAAGIGAFIKTALALNQRVLPPTAGCELPHALFTDEAISLYPLLRGRCAAPEQTLRAGVSAMGFGGINLHVTLRSGQAPLPELAPRIGTEAALASKQDSELVCLAATSQADLCAQTQTLLTQSQGMSLAQLVDLAARCQRQLQPGAYRLAVVCQRPEGLQQALTRALELLAGDLLAGTCHEVAECGLFLSAAHPKTAVGFMFPGQGSQRVAAAAGLVQRFDWAKALVAQADAWAAAVGTPGLAQRLWPILDLSPSNTEREQLAEALKSTVYAQPAIVLVSLIWLEYLQRLGVSPAVCVGHSLGELSAFYASGAYSAQTLIELACLRGQLMAATDAADGAGAMLSLPLDAKASQALIDQLAHPGILVVANRNSPQQTVLAGDTEAVEALATLAASQGHTCVRLRVSHAFHSPHMAGAAAEFARKAQLPIKPEAQRCPTISSIDGQAVDAAIDLRHYLAEQIVQPVDFVAAIGQVQQQAGLLLEVGPAAVLGQLAQQLDPTLAVAALEAKAQSWQSFNQALAKLFVRGWALDLALLYEQRLVNPFVPAAAMQFIVNPCEREQLSAYSGPQVQGTAVALAGIHADYWQQRGDFIRAVIAADQHSLSLTRGALPPTSTRLLTDKQSASEPAVRFNTQPPYAQTTPGTLPSVADLLFDWASSATGFSRASLHRELLLSDDLNLDSIKAGDFVGRIFSHYQLPDVLQPQAYHNASLGELMALVEQHSPAPLETSDSLPDAQALVISLAAEATGFAASAISLEQRLLDDLNLDSIKAGDLISKSRLALGVAEPLAELNPVTLSLGELAAALTAASSAAGTGQAKPQVAASQMVFAQLALMTGFAQDQLSADMCLADDLNLDSIKIGSLAAQLREQLSLGDVPAAPFAADTSVQEVINWVASQQAPGRAPAAAPAPAPAHASWVRCFDLQLAAAPLRTLDEASPSAGYVLGILCLAADQPRAKQLAQCLRRLGHQAEILVLGKTLKPQQQALINHWLLLPPNTPATVSGAELPAALALRATFASLSAEQQVGAISLVQFQAEQASDALGTWYTEGDWHTAANSAFAASLHLERPQQQTWVLDLPAVSTEEQIAAWLNAEWRSAKPYTLAYYDTQAQRYQASSQLLDTHNLAPRALSWSAQDWVLVTGGAKGITAACALAFAQHTRCRMLLLGSSAWSPSAHDTSEIGQNLAAFASAGLTAEYLACDLANSSELGRLLAAFEQQHGTITGVIHGAGSNRPRRAEQVSAAEAAIEIAPKLGGLLALCDYFSGRAPKLMLAMTSIIGVTGMAGNAWYAYANDACARLLGQFQRQHPSCQVAALAYSVWAELGMGARMGSTNHLAKMGIDAIPPALGIEAFMTACLQQLPSTQVVISSRLGGLDTWPEAQAGAQPVASRFAGQVQQFTPGVERWCEVQLSLADDLYLQDHYYRGVYLFPTVMGLEAMAQNLALVLGLAELPALQLHNIMLERPIIVDPDQGANIRLHVYVHPRQPEQPLRASAAIYTAHTQYYKAHFAADFVLAPPVVGAEAFSWPAAPLDLVPSSDLYGPLLFQGPLFQRLEQVWMMDDWQAKLSIRATAGQFFSAQHSQHFILGDPACRDVLLQSVQLSEQDSFLPVNIARLDIYCPPQQQPESWQVHSQIEQRLDNVRICAVAAQDANGQALERLTGYRLKRTAQNPQAPKPADWVNPSLRDQDLLQRALASVCSALQLNPPALKLEFFPQLSLMERSLRRINELPLISELISQLVGQGLNLSADDERLQKLHVHWREDGRPFVSGLDAAPDISLSHNSSHCLVIAGAGPQGCDIEDISPRSLPQWQQLLGPAQHALLAELAADEALDVAGTRIWSLLESAKKSLSTADVQLRQLGQSGEGRLFEARHGEQVQCFISLPMRFTRSGHKMIVISVAPQLQQQLTFTAPLRDNQTLQQDSQTLQQEGQTPQQDNKAPSLASGPTKRAFQFKATFKDTTSLSHGIDFPTFANWMGSIRELGIAEVGAQLVADFASGRWGMVTNHSDIQIFGAAACLDDIEGRVYISRRYGSFNSSIDMHFEWLRLGPEGEEELIALSNMATTWVEITGHGQVEVKPFPAYLNRFVETYLPADDAQASTAPHHFSLRKHTLQQHQALLGAKLYQAPAAPKVEPELARQVFYTSNAESNLVGNIYYANYYHWQNRVLERFFQALAPGLYTQAGCQGEFVCLRSEISHLREAMPFDAIEVVMALQQLYHQGLQLQFDFFKVEANGQRSKLAHGFYEGLWHTKTGTLASMPKAYLAALQQLQPA